MVRAMPTPLGRTGGGVAPASVSGTTSGGPNARFTDDPQLEQVLTGKLTLGDKSKGDGLKKVQQALSDMGFALPNTADGAYGPQTRKGLKNFQVNASKMFPDVKPSGKSHRSVRPKVARPWRTQASAPARSASAEGPPSQITPAS